MFILHEIKLDISEDEGLLLKKAAGRLGLPEGKLRLEGIAKESLDAREKPRIYRVFSLRLSSGLGDDALVRAAKKHRLKYGLEDDEPFSLGCPKGS